MRQHGLSIGSDGVRVSLGEAGHWRLVCPASPVADCLKVSLGALQQFPPGAVMIAQNLPDGRFDPRMNVSVELFNSE